MSGINGIGGSGPVNRIIQHPVLRQTACDGSRPLRCSDRLELSGMSHLLGALKQGDMRTDKVADVKSQLNAGTYEDEQKLDAAIDRLLDDLD